MSVFDCYTDIRNSNFNNEKELLYSGVKTMEKGSRSLSEVSRQPFFRGSDSFFTKPAIQTKPTDEDCGGSMETDTADKIVQHLSNPVRHGDPNSNNLSTTNNVIQRKCTECEKEEEQVQKKDSLSIQRKEDDSAAVPSAPGETPTGPTATATAPAASRFIVDDSVQPQTGQMRKAAFLDRLKTEVCDTVNSALAGTPFSSDNCPYIRASFARHQNSTPGQIEALIIRYCPSAAQAQTAEEVIQQMKIKVYAAALQWAGNGGDLSAASQLFGGIGNIASGIGGLFFKENTGGAKTAQSPQAVMQSLGKGTSIEGGTRSKMEAAFGTSFSNVEVHTDSNAAQLSSNMNARAFTVGNHIAFGGGEHQPGTIEGDALMAHELAHTLQQDGKTESTQMKGAEYNALEEDADNTAVSAVVSGLSGVQLFADEIPKQQMPKLKSGLKLQSCRRTVKQCPSGLRWSVVGLPAATGPVCVCTWRCLPPGKGYSVSSYSAGDSSGPSVTCTNKDRFGRCPGEPDYKTVGSDYEVTDETPGTVIGVGAHMSPLGGQQACGCLPLDIEGDATGAEQVHAPLLPPGLSVTDFAAGIGAKRGAPPSAKDPKPRPAIVEPLVPKTTPKTPVTTSPPVVGKPPVTTPAPPVTSPSVSGKPPATTAAPPATTLPPVPGKPPVTKPPVAGTPVTPLTPAPAPTPTVPGPIASGEALSVPYKGSTARATVLEVGGDFVKVQVKSKSRSGDITQTIPKAKFDEMLRSGLIIRWTAERQRLMDRRPDYAEGQVEKVWAAAGKASPDGQVRDPNTKEVLTWDKSKGRFDQWHMGHKKGEKYSDLVDSYVNGKITYGEFMKKYQDPANYQPEKPAENVSHKHE